MKVQSLIQSSLLAEIGVPHGFSLARQVNGGDRLDFSPNRGVEQIESAMAVICSELTLDRTIQTVNQVHGNHAVYSSASLVRAVWQPLQSEADSLLSRDKTLLVGVRTADCLPILVSNKGGDLVAAIHAGWRGVAGRAIEVAITELCRQVDASELVAAIGPAISEVHFEVGSEVLEEMKTTLPGKVVWSANERTGKPHISLNQTAKKILLDLGLEEGSIDIIDVCTYADNGMHSYRRDGKASGRQLSVIGVK